MTTIVQAAENNIVVPTTFTVGFQLIVIEARLMALKAHLVDFGCSGWQALFR